MEGSDQFRKHRAIKILNPTTELTGIYKCKVSSFVDEDFMQKPMIVYGEYVVRLVTQKVRIVFESACCP